MMKLQIIPLAILAICLGCDREKPKSSESTGSAAQHQSAHSRPPEPKFISVSQIIDVVPKNLRPDGGEEWTDLKIAAANEILADKAVNQLTLTHAKVDYAELTPGGEYAGFPRMLAQQPEGVDTHVTLWCYFPKKALADAAELKKNDFVAVTGKIAYAKFDHNRALTINLTDCDATKPK